MNVFVLNTGRCGSTTFIHACRHITNYSAAHESRVAIAGKGRIDYPEQHIEADNRLSWFLGRLDRKYGNDAFYVHLKRDDEATARSLVRRYDSGIMEAYRGAGILMGLPEESDPMLVSLDYCDTVNSNIDLFLKDKTEKMTITLENIEEGFEEFWGRIKAEGDLDAALAECRRKQNASAESRRELLRKAKVREKALVKRKLFAYKRLISRLADTSK